METPKRILSLTYIPLQSKCNSSGVTKRVNANIKESFITGMGLGWLMALKYCYCATQKVAKFRM